LSAFVRGVHVETRAFDGAVDAKDYDNAFLSLAWCCARTTGHRYLIFGHVELLPRELPVPATTPEWNDRLGSQSDYRLYGRRVLISSTRALDWYAAATEGRWIRPDNDGTLPAASRDNMEKPLASVVQEPRWPSTVMRTARTDVLPFIPNDYACPRIHHVLSEAPEIFDVLSPSERSRAALVIRQQLRFDINKGGHLWQSLHLTAPDPKIRQVGTVLGTSSDDALDTEVKVNVVPRAGQTTGTLTVRVKEIRESGERLLASFRAPEFEVRAPVAEHVDQITVEIEDDARGLVYVSGPYAFIRSIHMQMSIGGSTRRVQAPARKRASAVQYDVTVSRPDAPMIIGKSPPMAASKILRQAAGTLAALNASRHQFWFDGDANAAGAVIRGLLGKAQRKVRIVDMFFGAGDVPHYLPAVGHADAELEVLTSREGLDKRSRLTDETERYRGQAVALQARTREYVAARVVNETRVRVMTGARADVHDRFLCIDDAVWLLGSSLNEFGSRGTVLVKLPEPDSVRPMLDAAWAAAVPLDDVVGAPP
jgi:hypothetical protein